MNHRGTILVCDDDPNVLSLTRDILETEGHRTDGARDATRALEMLEAGPYDLLLCDLVLPGPGGLDLLRHVKRNWPEMEVIIITGHGDVDSAVRAIKEGAYDYLTKPFHPQTFAIDVQKALERKRLSEDLEDLRQRSQHADRLGDLLGRSPAMQAVFRLIEQVAPTHSTVMILGESGTGKEVTAREIHGRSGRRDGPFVAVSCATIPASLLESELFGHVKGAFTGAHSSKPGLFEAAEGGTLLLDEIGATTPRAQVGLLRVLQDREVRRIGSTEWNKVDVRVIAATNVDLEKAMDSGSFRTDLYYRLTGVTLRLPVLRERVEDVPFLAQHFLMLYGEKLGKHARALSPRALELLCGYPWPGNVRELEHVIEHAVIFAERDVVRPRDLPESVRQGRYGRGPFAFSPLEEVERNHIRLVLQHTNGNKVKAARILGIPRASLYRRIARFDLDHRRESAGGGRQILAPSN